MFIMFKGTKVFYKIENKNAQNSLLFLNGWGYDYKVLKPLGNLFPNHKKIYIDFPPFGQSEEFKCGWKIEDFADLVKVILDKQKIKKTQIIAHSFGGRVAIMLEYKYNITESLVLVASAGLKPRKNLRLWLKIKIYKHKKKRGKNVSGYGSEEYRALNSISKKTFVNVVNFDQTQMCKNINVRTLIIAGKRDTATPLYMHKKFKRLLKNSSLVVLNAGHYVWVDEFALFARQLKNFIRR